MDYVPFKDYFSLSDVAWNSDLLGDLDRIMSPPQCVYSLISSDNDTGERELPLNGLKFDPLDDVRCNSYEDFKRNGVEADLDEIDQYQHQLREVRTLTDAGTNPALAYYINKQRKNKHIKKVCVFCKNNGELPSVYNSHVLKDADGKVTCPILRKYICPLCGTHGDTAHTISYCPQNINGASAGLLLFQNSNRDSAGRLKVRK